MKRKKNVILGVDPGLNKTGWAIINSYANFDTHIAHGEIITKSNQELGKRLSIIYDKLLKLNLDVLYDDIKESSGIKFNRMNLLGIPYQIIIGSRLTENRKIELKFRKTNETKLFSNLIKNH